MGEEERGRRRKGREGKEEVWVSISFCMVLSEHIVAFGG